ncbi:MAG: PH domain-containing protein [Streptomyces sp.]|nr:PH domain-containing protein [Streptomyces sp.]
MAFSEKLLAASEEIVLSRRPSWWAMARPAGAVAVGALAIWACMRLLPDGGAATVVKVVVLAQAVKLVVLAGCVSVLRWARTEYTLTSHRLVMRHGVIRRSVWELPLDAVARMSVESGRFEGRFGSGTLVVEAGEGGRGRVLRHFPLTEHARRTFAAARRAPGDRAA